MSGQPSLADMAVTTLITIKMMEDGISSDAPEKYAIHEMRRAAEQAVLNGFQLASSIAWAARSVREAVADTKKAAQEASTLADIKNKL